MTCTWSSNLLWQLWLAECRYTCNCCWIKGTWFFKKEKYYEVKPGWRSACSCMLQLMTLPTSMCEWAMPLHISDWTFVSSHLNPSAFSGHADQTCPHLNSLHREGERTWVPSHLHGEHVRSKCPCTCLLSMISNILKAKMLITGRGHTQRHFLPMFALCRWLNNHLEVGQSPVSLSLFPSPWGELI